MIEFLRGGKVFIGGTYTFDKRRKFKKNDKNSNPGG